MVCSRGEEGAPWQAMENAWGRPVHTMWEYFFFERLKAKKFMKDTEKKRRKGYKANGNVSRLPMKAWNK